MILDSSIAARKNGKRLPCEALQAENAKLKQELEAVGTASYLYARSDLKAENAKLRELVRDYERCTMHADCSMCEYDGKLSTHCPLSPCFPDTDELRELGVEVDDGQQ